MFNKNVITFCTHTHTHIHACEHTHMLLEYATPTVRANDRMTNLHLIDALMTVSYIFCCSDRPSVGNVNDSSNNSRTIATWQRSKRLWLKCEQYSALMGPNICSSLQLTVQSNCCTFATPLDRWIWGTHKKSPDEASLRLSNERTTWLTFR